MATQGTRAPTGISSGLLCKAGASRVNLTQRPPYESREGLDNYGVYEELQPFMESFLENMIEQVRYKLKDDSGFDFPHFPVSRAST